MFSDGPRTTDDLNLLPPPELTRPLWASLLGNLRDRFAPEHLPPVVLTSKPVDVGMLVGDIIDLPWYRTIFSNIGDVISPETLPPLQLESQPVEVELVSDQGPWWGSLLRNLADKVAPEKLPALHLTSPPYRPEMDSEWLLAPRWSSVIDTPKLFLPDEPAAPVRALPALPPLRTAMIDIAPLVQPVVDRDLNHELLSQLTRTLRRAHLREGIWLGLAAAEIIFLLLLRWVRF